MHNLARRQKYPALLMVSNILLAIMGGRMVLTGRIRRGATVPVRGGLMIETVPNLLRLYCHSFYRRFDKINNGHWVGDHCRVRRPDLNDLGIGAFGHEELDVRGNDLITRADQVPGGDLFPGRGSRWLCEST